MRAYKKAIYVVFSIIILSGCVSSSMDYTRDQFSSTLRETQLNSNSWRVSFSGGSNWSKDAAEDQALLRSADITLQNDFIFFVIDSSSSTSRDSTIQINPSVSIPVSKPEVSYTVIMYKEKPDAKGVIYDALFLCDSLAKKLEAQCGTF